MQLLWFHSCVETLHSMLMTIEFRPAAPLDHFFFGLFCLVVPLYNTQREQPMHKHYRRDLLDSLKRITQRIIEWGRFVCVYVRENQRASANRKLMHCTIVVVDRWIREITKKKERNVDVRHFLAPAERIRDGGAYNRRPNNNNKKKKTN